MEKAYKYRIYPNKKQKELLAKTFGCCRFVYNHFLNKRIETYQKDQKTLTYNQCSAELTKLKSELEWLKEPDKCSLPNALKDMDRAYKIFFKNININNSPKTTSFHKSCNKGKQGFVFKGNGFVRFAGTHPGVLTVLSGMTYMEHLQDNVSTYSPLVPLTEDELAFLEETAELMQKYPTIPCNDCKYCMPCPYGLDIPGIFLHYNKCVNEGDIIADKSDDNYKKARRAFLVGYDRSVPKLRQADHCIKCGECVSACPQRIRIPREMEKIHQYVESLKRGL